MLSFLHTTVLGGCVKQACWGRNVVELERSSSIAKHLLANFSQNLTDGVQIARMLQPLSFIKLSGQAEGRYITGTPFIE